MQLHSELNKTDKRDKAVLCVIPARGGSKGILRKNIRPLAGKPLIYYSIRAAVQAQLVSRVVVSTEDEEIARIAKVFGAEVPFLRPKELAEDNVHSVYPVIDVIKRFQKTEGYSPDAVLMLLPTSPLRASAHIDEAIALYFTHKKGSVISVCLFEKPLSAIRKIETDRIKPVFKVENFNAQRQDSKFYLVNAAIYIASPQDLIEKQTFHVDEVWPYIMKKSDSIDINDEIDFQLAEFFMSKIRHKDVERYFQGLDSIDLIVYDFDGVMTDNKLLFSQRAEEAVLVNRADGLGISMIKKMGIPQLILSTETNPVITARAAKVRLPVLQGIADKKKSLLEYCDQQGYDISRVIYVGNDINDLEIMCAVGFPVAPKDAHEKIVQVAKLVLDSKGGEGVVRELANYIMEVPNGPEI